MTTRRSTIARIACLCALIELSAAVAWADVPVSVSVSQSLIRITPRYQGELVRVTGTAPADCAVVVKLTSPRGEAHFSKKGKVGPLWLSVGKVSFNNVPTMYKLKSNAPINDLLTVREQEKYVLGRRGLKASISGRPSLDRNVYLDEMILIREQRRFFSFHQNAVHRQGTSFSTTFFWPPNGPPGHYHVEAFAVLQGHVVGMAETGVQVQIVGIEAWVRRLAVAHGVLYGILAVLIAVASGSIVFVVFKGSRRPSVPPRPSESM